MKPLPDVTPDTPTIDEIRAAFARLRDDAEPRWGRMRAAQMTEHCRKFVELCLGRVPVTLPIRVLARMIGPPFLRRLVAKSPMQSPKNLRTLEPLRAVDGHPLDLDAERQRLSAALDDLLLIGDPHRHPLYGPMRKVDVEALVRHHTTHHLNQFGLV